jgi:hypothetical protein
VLLWTAQLISRILPSFFTTAWIFGIKERAALMNWPSLIGTLVLIAEIRSLRTRSELLEFGVS